MSDAERETFTSWAQTWAQYTIEHGGVAPFNLTATLHALGYQIIESTPASGSVKTFTYWTPTGELETSEVALR